MKRKNRMSKNMTARILRGIVTSTAITMLSAIIFTFLTLSEKINLHSNVYIYPIIAVSMFLGGLSASVKVNERIGIIIGITAGCYTLILVGLAIMFFDGLGASALYGLLSIAAGAALSCTICIRHGSVTRNGKRVSV